MTNSEEILFDGFVFTGLISPLQQLYMTWGLGTPGAGSMSVGRLSMVGILLAREESSDTYFPLGFW